MRAQNLTISVPLEIIATDQLRCNKQCPYCVSRMTFKPEPNITTFKNNIDKVLTIARAANVTSVLITGKGETFLYEELDTICKLFKNYPIEIQTNGILLKEAHDKGVSEFCDIIPQYVNVLAFSIDTWEQWESYSEIFKTLKVIGRVIRITLNVTDMIGMCYKKSIDMAKETGVHQLSFRHVVIPKNAVDTQRSREAQKWIKEHKCTELYHMVKCLIEYDNTKKEIRKLPFGTTVYDIDGISVTYFDECVQSKHNIDDIRSLIYQEDGHLYTTWDSTASILF